MREQNGLTMEETPGTRFGNYELVRRIDIGGMGEVYLARQLTAFSRSVAIKIIRSDLVHDTTARARFLREAEVSAHLKHEHILPLFDFGEVEGRLYLVTPYIEGGTLSTLLQTSGSLSLEETHTLFVPLVQAVAYIHRRGVVHRDLKPTNIMLDTEDGSVYVRLIDFGIASLQGRAASPPLTTAGHEMGTVAYMAPERLSGIAAPSNDIFSLGVILHQMLTGRMPTASPPSPHSVVPRLAEPLDKVVRRAVIANPNERYGTAEELLKSFEQAYQHITNPVPPALSTSGSELSPLTPHKSAPDLSVSQARPELVSLAQSSELPEPIAQTPVHQTRPPVRLSFAPEDYNAPTTVFQRPLVAKALPNSRPPLLKPRLPKTPGQARAPRRNRLVLVVSALTVVVLIVFAGMLYYGYQLVDATNVTVNFSPRTRVISQVVTLKADPKVSSVNLTSAVIPARALTSPPLTKSQSASTTGQVNCVLGGLGCQQGVSQNDIDNLISQMQPDLDAQIKQNLESQIQAQHGTQLGAINIVTSNVATPPLNSPGNTVSVTLSEHGSVGYFVNADASQVAHQALTRSVVSLGAHYQLVDSTIRINAFKIQSIDQVSGISTIATSEGAVVLYHLTSDDLQTISQGLVGKSLAAARAFLQNQPGIDPATVQINFTSGSKKNSMPTDVQHIKLIPLNPGTLPAVSLTPVAQATLTQADQTPITVSTSTPTSTNTPTDNG
jgi:serine/threonine protein kinase